LQGNCLIKLIKSYKIGVQGTLTTSSSAFFCCLSALAAHNLQVISMRSLRSAKIPKGPGNQKPVQLVEAHTCLSVRLLRPRESKNKPCRNKVPITPRSLAATVSRGPVKREVVFIGFRSHKMVDCWTIIAGTSVFLVVWFAIGL
jgi:hypothetical protein